MMKPCRACGCTSAPGTDAHAVLAALVEGDLDRAIDLGLLAARPCARCATACTATLVAARDARLAALAARDRYRARQQRIERRARMRGAARSVPAESIDAGPAAPVTPPLPSAAAAALARARARASKPGSA